MKTTSTPTMLIAQAALMTHAATATLDPSTDPNIDPRVRALLIELIKDSSPF